MVLLLLTYAVNAEKGMGRRSVRLLLFDLPDYLDGRCAVVFHEPWEAPERLGTVPSWLTQDTSDTLFYP
jgi:hypothetical protein